MPGRLHRKLEAFTGPAWPAHVRFALVLVIAVLGFVCQHWRLTSAHQFGVIGFVVLAMVLLVKRAMWKRALRRHAGN